MAAIVGSSMFVNMGGTVVVATAATVVVAGVGVGSKGGAVVVAAAEPLPSPRLFSRRDAHP